MICTHGRKWKVFFHIVCLLLYFYCFVFYCVVIYVLISRGQATLLAYSEIWVWLFLGLHLFNMVGIVLLYLIVLHITQWTAYGLFSTKTGVCDPFLCGTSFKPCLIKVRDSVLPTKGFHVIQYWYTVWKGFTVFCWHLFVSTSLEWESWALQNTVRFLPWRYDLCGIRVIGYCSRCIYTI